MTIDVHTHYLPESMAEALRERTAPPWIERMPDGSERAHMPVGALAFTTDYTDMQARLRFMDDLEVKVQILSFPGLFGADSLPLAEALPLVQIFNDDVSRLQAAHPDRFLGLASLPFADIDATVAEYRRARTELNLIGAILPINAFETKEIAQSLLPLFEAGQELGGHFFLHPGPRPDQRPPAGAAPRKPAYSDNLIYRNSLDVQSRVGHAMTTLLFTDFLEPYDGISLHVANLGGTLPPVIERLDEMAKTRLPDEPLPSTRMGGIFVDCSSLGPRTIELTAAFVGADRILLGTDCPIFRTQQSLKAVSEARLTDAEKTAILRGNAEGLLAPYLK